ncbi:uncharacterized protein BDV17DRAFT_288247 [Aspergillus undulatus]|uniref:uncharacterized protein n=1 Tax=Aspergillus undulatus TaxID=1810928 RepID=UPI003CCE309A
MARILDPHSVPTLQILVLGGEALSREDIYRWFPHVKLFNAYGPTECSIVATVHLIREVTSNPAIIGRSMGSSSWVVNANDAESLCSVDEVDELVVSGPIVAREYMEDQTKTVAAFVDCPILLRGLQPGACGKVYKTGDLVRRHADGSFEYLGRKDTQFKINGQRMEPNEVEYHLRECLPAVDLAVEKIAPKDGLESALLAAFVVLEPEDMTLNHQTAKHEPRVYLTAPAEGFRLSVGEAKTKLQRVLPNHMVPTAFLSISRMPLTTSGKLDRQALREIGCSRSQRELKHLGFGFVMAARVRPRNSIEQTLQRLWAEVLQLLDDSIAVGDNFWSLGGDSLRAMKLAALARKRGLLLVAENIWGSNTLEGMASHMQIDQLPTEDVPAFSLCQYGDPLADLDSTLRQHQIKREDVEDVYPCTPMQEGMMALTLKSPGKYVTTIEYALRDGVDVSRFQAAVDSTIAANPILRTRFMQGPSSRLQVVIKEPASWKTYSTLQDYEARYHSRDMGPNKRLLHLSLINHPSRLIMTTHHALVDGWSMPLLWEQVEASYQGQPRPFSPFIRYLQQKQDSTSFWVSQFEDLKAAVYPTLPFPAYEPKPNETINRSFSMASCIKAGCTLPTAIQMTWAIIMSHYTDSQDVVFGLTLSGRAAPIAGIDRLTGPTITTVPFRVRLKLEDSILVGLREIKKQLTAMIAHEQTGLRKIGLVSENAANACEFQSHLAIQPPPTSSSDSSATKVDGGYIDYGPFSSYGIVLVCHLAAEAHQPLNVIAQFDPNMLEPNQARRVVTQFEHVLHQILTSPHMPVSSISAVSDQDWQQLGHWNATLPFISRRDAPAISAWDGDFTFKKLASVSGQLARSLRNQGLREGSIVPVCLEKSKWCVVAMMAVLRAGAAVVCIEPKLPAGRLQQMCNQVKPQMVIASEDTRGKFTEYDVTMIIVPEMDEHSEFDREATSMAEVRVEPSASAFIILTSGSPSEKPHTTQQPPSTPAERVFQRLFADLFGHKDADAIRNSDHFLRLGGDSIRVMTLIVRARKAGYHITLFDVLNNPRLCDLARAARLVTGNSGI